MMRRCRNPGSSDFRRYGARGITVHPAWHDAETFARQVVAEIGPLHPGMTIDRVDNDGNYEPGNVRWATRLAQARNRHREPLPEPSPLTAVRRNRTKLSHEQVTELLALVEAGMTQTATAALFGISQPHVSRLVREARRAT